MGSCFICNNGTEGKRVFCSESCQEASAEKPGKECTNCKMLFYPEKAKQVYCSLVCFNNKSGAERTLPLPEKVPGSSWIPLSQGKFALVDDALYEHISKFKWCAIKIGPIRTGHVTEKWYAKRVDYSTGKPVSVMMHRYIMNVSGDVQVDHANGNGLDNRTVNLRLATQAQNSQNVKSFGKSKYKGVVPTASGTFSVRIMSDRKSTYVGTFKEEEEAARAYDAAARKLHGRFAKVNFPQAGEISAI